MTVAAKSSGFLREGIRPIYMMFVPALTGFGIAGGVLIVRGPNFFDGATILPLIGIAVGLFIGLSWLVIEFLSWILRRFGVWA